MHCAYKKKRKRRRYYIHTQHTHTDSNNIDVYSSHDILRCPGVRASQEGDDTNQKFLLYLGSCNTSDFSAPG